MDAYKRGDNQDLQLELLSPLQQDASHGRGRAGSAAASRRSSVSSLDRSPPNTLRFSSYTALKNDFDQPKSTIDSRVSSSFFKPRQRRLTGWRKGVVVSAYTATVVCLINASVLLWLSTRPRLEGSALEGMVTAFQGSCDTTDRLSVTIHLCINALGSILLAASNYCMQCLSAPTRAECDLAHSKGNWLDIGVNSFRNLFKIHKGRTLLWVLIAFTSLPLHLIYNSTAFKVLSANSYEVFVVNPAYFNASTLWTPSDYVSSALDLHYSRNPNCTMHNQMTTRPDAITTKAANNGTIIEIAGFPLSVTPYSCLSDCSLNATTLTNNGTYETLTLPNMGFTDLMDQIGDSYGAVYLTYSNGRVAHIDTSVQVSETWAPLGGCNLINCSMVIADNTVVGDPTVLTEMTDCFSDVDASSWRNDALQAQHTSLDQWQKLSLDDCLAIYGQDFVSEYNNVFFVTGANINASTPSAFFSSRYDEHPIWTSLNAQVTPHDWICHDEDARHCNVQQVRQDLSNYELGGVPIDHCLAESMAGSYCKLQFSIPILAVVVACNAIKALLMFLTVYWHREPTLVVLGDAIASYLDRSDLHTVGRCLVEAKQARRRARFERPVNQGHVPLSARQDMEALDRAQLGTLVPKSITASYLKRRRMVRAVSPGQLTLTMILATMCIIATSGLLGQAVSAVRDNVGYDQSPWQMGFGSANAQLSIELDANTFDPTSKDSFTTAMLLSNTPQLIVSCVYVMYNGVLTTFLQAREWSMFASLRRSLRVTSPVGQQRSTYFLSLPYRFSLPLLLASSVLHWLISSSIFLVRVDPYIDGINKNQFDVSFLGYSPLPILLAVLLGTAMVIGGIIMGCFKLRSAMPVASSNSYAISAACHQPEDDSHASLLPVQWGEPKEYTDAAVGHCCFTSQDVDSLKIGRSYA